MRQFNRTAIVFCLSVVVMTVVCALVQLLVCCTPCHAAIREDISKEQCQNAVLDRARKQFVYVGTEEGDATYLVLAGRDQLIHMVADLDATPKLTAGDDVIVSYELQQTWNPYGNICEHTYVYKYAKHDRPLRTSDVYNLCTQHGDFCEDQCGDVITNKTMTFQTNGTGDVDTVDDSNESFTWKRSNSRILVTYETQQTEHYVPQKRATYLHSESQCFKLQTRP